MITGTKTNTNAKEYDTHVDFNIAPWKIQHVLSIGLRDQLEIILNSVITKQFIWVTLSGNKVGLFYTYYFYIYDYSPFQQVRKTKARRSSK